MDKNIYNKKIKNYSNDEIKNIESNKIKISKSDEDIISFVKESLDTKSSNKKIYYGKINDLLAEEIYEKLLEIRWVFIVYDSICLCGS